MSRLALPEAVSLNRVASVFKMHPRTVLRHLRPWEDNPYWVRGYEEDIPTTELMAAFNVIQRDLAWLLTDRDVVWTWGDLIEWIEQQHGVRSLSTLRKRRYPKLYSRGPVTRYSRRRCVNYHFIKYGDLDDIHGSLEGSREGSPGEETGLATE